MPKPKTILSVASVGILCWSSFLAGQRFGSHQYSIKPEVVRAARQATINQTMQSLTDAEFSLFPGEKSPPNSLLSDFLRKSHGLSDSQLVELEQLSAQYQSQIKVTTDSKRNATEFLNGVRRIIE